MVLGLFLLRLGVPLAVTLAVGYWLRRLDNKWQAEARARWQAVDPKQKEIVEILSDLKTRNTGIRPNQMARIVPSDGRSATASGGAQVRPRLFHHLHQHPPGIDRTTTPFAARDPAKNPSLLDDAS